MSHVSSFSRMWSTWVAGGWMKHKSSHGQLCWIRRSSPWACCPGGKSSCVRCPRPRRHACSESLLSNGPRHFGPWQNLQTPGGKTEEGDIRRRRNASQTPVGEPCAVLLGPELSGKRSNPRCWAPPCSSRAGRRCGRGKWGRWAAGTGACCGASPSACCRAAPAQWTPSPVAGLGLGPPPAGWWCSHHRIW